MPQPNAVKCLVVDDEPRLRRVLVRLLEGEGYSTATAWGGREALALSEKARFDLMLVDEHVGDVDFDALRKGLALRQPAACQLLMHTRKGRPTSNGTICKWEHAEMKAKIRCVLAA